MEVRRAADNGFRAMNCPDCSAHLDRSHRHGLIDKLRCLRGHRPYRCFKCNKRFFLRVPPADVPAVPRQQVPPETVQATSPPPVPPKHPEIRLELDREKPTAQLTIEADSHQELENLLSALNEAVVKYENVGAEK